MRWLVAARSPRIAEWEFQTAMASLASLIRYLHLMSEEANFGQFELKKHDLSMYLRLDASAVKALHLLPGPNDGWS